MKKYFYLLSISLFATMQVLAQSWSLNYNQHYLYSYGKGVNNGEVYQAYFSSSGSPSPLTISSFSFRTLGTYDVSDIKPSGIKLWLSRHSTFSPISSTLLGTGSVITTTGSIVTINTNNTIPIISGMTNYIYVTVDISNTAAIKSSFFCVNSITGVVGTAPGATFNIPTNSITQYISVANPTSMTWDLQDNYNAGYVAAGTQNLDLIRMYQYGYTSDYNLESMTFSTSGTALAADISRFVLVHNRYIPGLNIYADVIISTLPGANAGTVLNFVPNTGTINTFYQYNKHYSFNYYYVRAEISPSATAGRTIRLSSFHPSQASVTGITMSGNSLQSRGEFTVSGGVMANMILTGGNPSAAVIGKGTINRNIFHFYLSSQTSGDAKSLVLTFSGSYTSSDISSIKLYYRNNSSSFNTNTSFYVTSVPSTKVGSSEVVTFNFNKPLYQNNQFDNFYFIAVDVSNSAADNATIYAAANNNSFTFSSPHTVTGSPLTSNVFTIASPVITYTQIPTTTTSAGLGTIQSVYSFILTPSVANTKLIGLILTATGSATSSDISYIGLHISTDPYFNPNNTSSIVNNTSFTTATGLVLTQSGYDLYVGNTYYVHLFTRTRTAATAGNNYKIWLNSKSDLLFTAATVTGTPNTGVNHTIKGGAVGLSTVTRPGGKVYKGSSEYENIYSVRFDVSEAPVYFNYYYANTFGNYTSSDINQIMNTFVTSQPTYTAGDYTGYLYETTSYTSNSTGAGENLYISTGNYLPIGTYYMHLNTRISSSGTLGNTIGVQTLFGFDFPYSTTLTGSPTTGNLFTISGIVITVTSLNTNNSLYPRNRYFYEQYSPALYSLRINTGSSSATLSDITLSVTGALNTSDISSYYLLLSTSYPYDQNYSSTSSSSPTGGVLDFNPSWSLSANSTYYIHLLPYYTYSSSLNKDIMVKALDINTGIQFANATTTGSTMDGNRFIMKNLYTISNHTVTSENLAIGDNDVVVGVFKISNISYNGDYLRQLVVSLTGNFTSSDITNLRLSYNSDGNQESRNELTTTVISGNTATFGDISSNLLYMNNYATYYFYISADVLPGATAGRSIALASVLPDNILITNNATFTGTISPSPTKTLELVNKWTYKNEYYYPFNHGPLVQNALAYKGIISRSGNPSLLTVSSYSFVTGGSYSVSGIVPNSAKLWLSHNSEFIFDKSTLLGVGNITVTSGNIVTIPTNQSIMIGNSTYVYLTIDIASPVQNNSSFFSVYSVVGFVGTAPGALAKLNPLGIYNEYVRTNNPSTNYNWYNNNTLYAGYVTAGTRNLDLFDIYSYHYTSRSSLNHLVVSTSGTFLSTDINRFMLWANIYDPTIQNNRSFLVATLPGVNAGTTLNFMYNTGVPNNTPMYQDYSSYNYYYIGADISTSAGIGRTLKLSDINTQTQVSINGVSFNSGTVQARPMVTFTGGFVGDVVTNNPPAKILGKGLSDQYIYGFGISAQSNANATSVTVTLSGTYTASDIESIKLFKSLNVNFNSDPSYLLATANSTKSGSSEVVTFNFNTSLVQGYTAYFFIAVNISPNSNNLVTISASTNTTSILIPVPNTLSGVINPGVVHTIASPIVTYTQIPVNTTSAGIGTTQTVYAFSLVPTVADTKLHHIIITATGLATGADIDDLYLTHSTSDPNFNPYSYNNIRSINTYGNSMTFAGLDLDLNVGTTYFFNIVVYTQQNATPNRNFRIRIKDLSGLVYNTGTAKIGTPDQGNDVMIKGSNIHFTSLSRPGGIANKGLSIFDNIYSLQVDVSGAPIYFQNFVGTYSGTYTSSQIASMRKMYLTDSPTFDPNNYIYEYENSGSSSTGSGESTSINLYQQINEGTYYLHIGTRLNSTAPNGTTIALHSITSINVPSGNNVTRSISTGSTFTVTGATMTVTSLNTIDKILPYNAYYYTSGMPSLYNIKVTTGNLPTQLNNITLTFTGSIANSDFNNFYLFRYDSYPYSQSNDAYWSGNANANKVLTFSVNNTLSANTTYYYYVLPYYTYDASIGKNIRFEALDLNTGIRFANGTATGSTLQGNEFVVMREARFSNFTIPASNLGKGVSDDLIQSFSIRNISGSTNTLRQLVITLSGTMTYTDMNRIRLTYNNNGNPNERYNVTNMVYTSVTGMVVTFGGPSASLHNISSGNTTYFYLSVDVTNSATNGRTIAASIDPAMSIFSLSNTTTTGGIMSGASKSISTPTVVLGSNPVATGGSLCACSNAQYYLLYSFELDVQSASTVLNTITFAGSGSYTSSDMSNLYLYYRNSPTPDRNNETYLTNVSVSSSGSGEIFTFNLNRTLNVGKHYFFIRLLYVQNNAAVGTNIRISPPAANTIVFSNAPSRSGSAQNGSTYTVVKPSVTISTHDVPSSYFGVNSEYNALYATKIVVNSDCAELYSYNVSFAGAYTTSDFHYPYYFISTTPGYSTYGSVNYNGSYSFGNPSNTVTGIFESNISPSYLLKKGTYYLYTTINVMSSPNMASTIKTVNNHKDNYQFTNANVSGSLTANGNTFYIGNSNAYLESFTVAGVNSLAAGVKNQPIYYIGYTVTGASAYLNYFYMNFGGNYVASTDIEPSGLKVWHSASQNFDAASALYLNSITLDANGSGESPYIYTSNTLPVGTGYLIITVDLKPGAVVAHNIKINSTSSYGYTANVFNINMKPGKNYVMKGLQTLLNFGPFANWIFTEPTVLGVNPTLSSGLPVTVTLNTDPATGVAAYNTGVLSILGLGSVTITASNLGDANYAAVNGMATFSIITVAGPPVPGPTNLANSDNEAGVSVYPNPANELLHVVASEPITSVTIFDAIGNQVYSTKQLPVNTSKLNTGLYFVVVQTAKAKVVKKVVVGR
ncbi:MAG: T9SS type A sorting domain-containing protein [Cytophagales bacterium]|nr:T9SS type A sorting domain-containing protein [Cytophagales bacterium]